MYVAIEPFVIIEEFNIIMFSQQQQKKRNPIMLLKSKFMITKFFMKVLLK